MTDVDVIVVNYRTPHDLETFVRSVKDQGARSITIVNNSPTQADRTTSHRLGGEVELTTIDHAENVGYARAANNAAVGLQSPVLAIFNADVTVPQGSLQAMVEFMDRHPAVGVAGPKQVDSAGRITHGGIFGTNERPQHRGWHKKLPGRYGDISFDAVSVSGSAYFVRRECWDELTACDTFQQSAQRHCGYVADGALLPTPLYYEETFCSLHARAHDWQVAYNGEVTMIHEWQGSSKDEKTLSRFMRLSRDMYRKACDDHGIPHE